MAPVDSGPILDTHPLGWRQAFFLAVKSRFVYLTGWYGNFWVRPQTPVPELAKVMVSDAGKGTIDFMWQKVRQ